jgi:hypothetical protein
MEWNGIGMERKGHGRPEAHKDDYVITIYDARKKKGSEKSSRKP